MTTSSTIVLLTGGSSGIGAATAKLLCRGGMTVYSASRSGGGDAETLENGRIIPVKMDVNDPSAVKEVVDRIVREQGRLDAVVCNAGNGIAGSVEDTSVDEARYQFETCFYGAVRTIDACLPVFRSQGHGRIVTVSSVAAVIPIPFQAYYSSVKAALHMLTRALSLEVKPFGIQCCCVLPGDTKTGFTKARKYTQASQEATSPYYQTMHRSVAKMEKDEQNGMAPEVIGKAILRQLGRRKMKLTVTPRIDYRAIGILVRILPERLAMWIIGLLYS